jgi:fatty-acyl-CoA synthase
MSLLMIPPLMHGAAQWGAFTAVTMGGRLVIPDDVEKFRPEQALQLAAREKVMGILTVGDAVARPLADELESGDYDLSGLVTISNGGAPMTSGVRERLRAALPSVILFDGVGSSESGMQMSAADIPGVSVDAATFAPQPDTTVVASDFSRVLTPGDGEGWLARRDLIPLGYLNDEAKSARTFPTIDGVRWSIPGDRARILADGRIELLGRDSVTINSGGEKIFAEEVERAVTSHPAVYDVVVVGRPSERWGSEVVAVVQLAEAASASDADLAAACRTRIASYKIPKAFIRVPKVVRSPAGKADYRWAKNIAAEALQVASAESV